VVALRRVIQPKWVPIFDSSLPVLPSAAAKLMRATSEAVSVSELEAIAASDPVLAGRLLGAANSALFGRHSEILDLRQAILRLGIPHARKALLAACFDHLFASRPLADIWRRSRLIAATAYELAGLCDFDQDLAYVAGLLHDIGRLLIHRCPAEGRIDEEALLGAGFPLVYAEAIVYGDDHATLGGELLKAWNLPSAIIEAITLHHSPERSDSVLTGILYIAEQDCTAERDQSKNLSAGMRLAAAVQTTGINGETQASIDRESPIFALAS
jgi:putative nucleotidyltransferase with HDIG domain